MKFYLLLKVMLGMSIVGGPYETAQECDQAGKVYMEVLKGNRSDDRKEHEAKLMCISYVPPLPIPRETLDV